RRSAALRAAGERAVVAGPPDPRKALQTPALHVPRVARPAVLGLVLARSQEPPHQSTRHVSGADEADLLHGPSPPPEDRGRRAPALRAPKSARPIRSNVAPSSTAIRKSSLIPINRWGSSTPTRLPALSPTPPPSP